MSTTNDDMKKQILLTKANDLDLSGLTSTMDIDTIQQQITQKEAILNNLAMAAGMAGCFNDGMAVAKNKIDLRIADLTTKAHELDISPLPPALSGNTVTSIEDKLKAIPELSQQITQKEATIISGNNSAMTYGYGATQHGGYPITDSNTTSTTAPVTKPGLDGFH
jgi:hypothetical protein